VEVYAARGTKVVFTPGAIALAAPGVVTRDFSKRTFLAVFPGSG
jgi:hypothetical protein